jgi:hypothetical protein
MCNANNPSGDILDSWWNYRILFAAFWVGIVVGVKRFIVGLYLGRRTFQNYGNQLAKVIHQMIVISKVAKLGKDLARKDSAERSSTGKLRGGNLTTAAGKFIAANIK